MSTDFRSAMDSAKVSALWERGEFNRGKLDETPYLWPWAELDPLLDVAVEQTDMENAERRVLVLENPSYQDTQNAGRPSSTSSCSRAERRRRTWSRGSPRVRTTF